MKTPASRGLAALSLVCVAAALLTRGLSSGAGQALQQPGSVLVLDAIGAIAAMAALGARFLEKEPGLIPERSVLAALGAFLALAFAGALHGASGSWRLAFSWASIAAVGLAIRDLARRPDLARTIAGTIVGVGCAAAVLGVYDYFVDLPEARREVEKNPHLYPPEMLYRVSDPMAAGPFLLPSHFACALGMVMPLAVLVTFSYVKRGDRLRAALAGLVTLALLVGIALARSKGATLSLGVGLYALVALTVASPRWRTLLLGLGAGAFLLALAVGGYRFVKAPDDFGMGLSVQVRVEYWRAAVVMAADRPLVGHGLERYPELMASYKTAKAEEAKHAHQDSLELLSELGVLGPVAFFGLIAALGTAGIRALRTQGPPRAPPRETVFAPGVTAVLGVALGALTLLTYGDVYNSEQWWKLFLAAGVASAVSFLVARALEDPGWANRAAGAALAGALVFVADGLTDFPLRVHGLVALAFALAFLAPALAEAPAPPPAAHPAARLAVGLPLAFLLAFGQYRVREDVVADGLRFKGREQIGGVLEVFRSGRRLTAQERANGEQLLGEGAQIHRRLLESRHLGVPDILLLIDAEEYHGRLSRDAHRIDGTRAIIVDALRQFPSSRELWAALGRHDAGSNFLDKATVAFDEAVRCYPTQPHTRLDAAVVRMVRIARGEPHEKLRAEAIHELDAALRCAYASRLERVHLTDEEIAAAQGFLVALGAPPSPPGRAEPGPPLPRDARGAVGR